MAKADCFFISREDDIVRIDYTRNPDREELMELMERLSGMENAELRMHVMIDAEIMLSTAEVREGAEVAGQLKRQPRRIAIVAPGNISYGISRIFKVFRESNETEFEVFRELDEARRWLRAD